MSVIVWFTFDLRLQDHAAIASASQAGEDVVPVFILDPNDPNSYGSASRWWLHHSLTALRSAIIDRGGQLILRHGDTVGELIELAEQSNSKAIYCTRAYEPWLANIQQNLFDACETRGIECKRFGGRLLLEPETVLNKQNEPYKVFTPYYKQALNQMNEPHLKRPRELSFYGKKLTSDLPSDWDLLPLKPNWAKGFESEWEPGEAGAHKALRNAVDTVVPHYPDIRDRPDYLGTSRLSPHLHFGEISPRQVWRSVKQTVDRKDATQAYLRQLFWRDFGHYLLHYFPHLPKQPFLPKFKNFPWRNSQRKLAAWQRGHTGYPIVDAGLRELWHTGWMHNRVRMIVASFLTKHLRMHWAEGADWFWDTLVDADLANNTLGWQWVAGCGVDAAPYFRVFNPMLQGQKFDPEGDYIKRWVPELQKLEKRFIHAPWEAPKEVLRQADIVLGDDYPNPIVDHQTARNEALEAYRALSD